MLNEFLCRTDTFPLVSQNFLFPNHLKEEQRHLQQVFLKKRLFMEGDKADVKRKMREEEEPIRRGDGGALLSDADQHVSTVIEQ